MKLKLVYLNNILDDRIQLHFSVEKECKKCLNRFVCLTEDEECLYNKFLIAVHLYKEDYTIYATCAQSYYRAFSIIEQKEIRRVELEVESNKKKILEYIKTLEGIEI